MVREAKEGNLAPAISMGCYVGLAAAAVAAAALPWLTKQIEAQALEGPTAAEDAGDCELAKPTQEATEKHGATKYIGDQLERDARTRRRRLLLDERARGPRLVHAHTRMPRRRTRTSRQTPRWAPSTRI